MMFCTLRKLSNKPRREGVTHCPTHSPSSLLTFDRWSLLSIRRRAAPRGRSIALQIRKKMKSPLNARARPWRRKYFIIGTIAWLDFQSVEVRLKCASWKARWLTCTLGQNPSQHVLAIISQYSFMCTCFSGFCCYESLGLTRDRIVLRIVAWFWCNLLDTLHIVSVRISNKIHQKCHYCGISYHYFCNHSDGKLK